MKVSGSKDPVEASHPAHATQASRSRTVRETPIMPRTRPAVAFPVGRPRAFSFLRATAPSMMATIEQMRVKYFTRGIHEPIRPSTPSTTDPVAVPSAGSDWTAGAEYGV